MIRRFARVALLSLAVFGAGCALRTEVVRQPSYALPPQIDTPSAHYIASELDRHPAQSGFRLLSRSTNALMSRIALADHAAHSIDLQYFVFEDDATGRLVAQRLLAAADRGVRVRMLLDDIHLGDKYDLLDALNAHKNISVRVFNPFRTRAPAAPIKAVQFLLEWRRLNRRMHNKAFIVDGTAVVLGGRNIGDAYFDAANSSNFRDLDVIAIGPVVAQAAKSFDDYWNSDAAYPVTAFRKRRDDARELARVRDELAHHERAFAQSDYALEVLEEFPNGPTADRRGAWFWGAAEFVADQPEKIEARDDEPALRIGPHVQRLMDDAQTELLALSPYFVPGDGGTRYLGGRARQGVSVKVLTNSLASTDEPIAHAGYEHYRRRLLEDGVQLFELRPAPGEPQPATAAGLSAGVSLHAKAIVVDRRYVFVGSMNMDQRSKLLNTEMGVIVDSPGLAQAIAEFFDKATAPQSAYAVRLQHTAVMPAHLQWVAADENGAPQIYDHEPGATARRRVETILFRLLPIDGLL